MNKIKCAIIGSGNIGTDLMMKLENHPTLELTMVVGIDPKSEGLALAREKGYETTSEGIEGFVKRHELAQIVYDATSAKVHSLNAPILKSLGKTAIDLTPAAVGPYVIPDVNIGDVLDQPNVNLCSCAGQATIPIVAAVSRVTSVKYAEVVGTVASRSAGPGTRQNIDEFTRTTSRAVEQVGRAKTGRALVILNPAEPPIIMTNTIYCLTEDPDQEAITQSIHETVKRIQEYVPGYRIRLEPNYEDGWMMTTMEVEGAGMFLPTFAGNLDIMTAAAVKVGEEFAKHLVDGIGATSNGGD